MIYGLPVAHGGPDSLRRLTLGTYNMCLQCLGA
jgi:hypothetical protein